MHQHTDAQCKESVTAHGEQLTHACSPYQLPQAVYHDLVYLALRHTL
jgi:hypothetical protein